MVHSGHGCTVVLVPGACHGGWWYEPLAARLTDLGHPAVPVTLAGLDPDLPTPQRVINLDTHVVELVEVLSSLSEPALLVGHSYGGSVITAAADRLPDQVRALVYLDAFVPGDGDSCWSMTNDEQRAWYIDGCADSGVAVQPMPWFDERARPHPLATLVQRVGLTGAWRNVPVRHYVLAAEPEWLARSPFVPVADRLRDDPEWTVHDLPVTHNVLRDGPEAILTVLRDVLMWMDGATAGQ